MKRFRAAYERLLEWVVVALMVLLFVEVTLGVVFRFLGQALSWYDEVASHLLAWLTFYGAALASVKRAHIGCPEVVEMMPWRARRLASIVAQVIVIAFFVVLGSVGAWIMPVLATDALISLPEIPMSVVQSVIPISSLLIVVAEVAYLAELLLQAAPPKMPSPAIADELQ
ncbi:MAG TPA: TRAP transporter small permease [Casimicrobiaceae bacterium]|nr:TRAP transporter small permease [Casimicrobiaceae bacterium]